MPAHRAADFDQIPRRRIGGTRHGRWHGEGIRQRCKVCRKVEDLLRRQRSDVHAHDVRVALAALVVFELLVERGRALAGQIRERRVAADAVRPVAVVAGRREGRSASRVTLRQQAARRGRPRDVRGRLALSTHGSLRGADRQADRAADRGPKIDGCTGLGRRKPDEADHRRDEEQHDGAADPGRESRIAFHRTWTGYPATPVFLSSSDCATG